MHMADALVSPAVGGTMWAVSAGLIGYGSGKAKKYLDDKTAPLMGVLGAFVFAAQMINFTIPATGSSGHLGGGLLLAILLGPWASFLTVASILTVQALFFADGGILALGCNIINIGFFPCLVAYPLFFRPVVSGNPSRARIFIGSAIAAVTGLQFGSLGVVLQTSLSGITELPLSTFALFMQPIHLAIGLVEGLATGSIVLFLQAARPDILYSTAKPLADDQNASPVPIVKIVAFTALITGGLVSWFASTHPDGLEWSIQKTSGAEEVAHRQNTIHNSLQALQERTAILPDYGFGENSHSKQSSSLSFPQLSREQTGTTVSGLVGSAVFLLFAAFISFLFRFRRTET